MARIEPLTTRPLGPDDAAAGFALSTEAGWNQTVADWQFMLAAGDAQGQVTPTGDLVASALVLPFADRIGWIGMVLTTASHRRRGLATENLRWAIAHCEARGLIAGLDATPAGREVYAPLGFAEGFGLQRLTAEEPTLAVPDAPGIRLLEASDLPAVTALDATAFGAERAGAAALSPGQPDVLRLGRREGRYRVRLPARARRPDHLASGPAGRAQHG